MAYQFDIFLSSPKLLSDADVQREVRHLASVGCISWSVHVLRDSMPKRRITKGDVVAVLKRGVFVERPFNANVTGGLEYKFTMRHTVDGEVIDVAASLRTAAPDVFVITVYRT